MTTHNQVANPPPEDEVAEEVERDPHEQDPAKWVPSTETFDGAQFVCYLGDIRFNKRGDVVITLTVPYRYRNHAIPMATSYGIPLSLDAQRWKYYDAARAMANDE